MSYVCANLIFSVDKYIIGNNSGNSQNGYEKKTIKGECGESEISVPRDRNGSFEPCMIEKRQSCNLQMPVLYAWNKHG